MKNSVNDEMNLFRIPSLGILFLFFQHIKNRKSKNFLEKRPERFFNLHTVLVRQAYASIRGSAFVHTLTNKMQKFRACVSGPYVSCFIFLFSIVSVITNADAITAGTTSVMKQTFFSCFVKLIITSGLSASITISIMSPFLQPLSIDVSFLYSFPSYEYWHNTTAFVILVVRICVKSVSKISMISAVVVTSFVSQLCFHEYPIRAVSIKYDKATINIAKNETNLFIAQHLLSLIKTTHLPNIHIHDFS